MGDEGEEKQPTILFVERADDSFIFDELDDKKVSVKKVLVFNTAYDRKRQEAFEYELDEELAYITKSTKVISPKTKLKQEYEEYKKTIHEIMEEPMSFEDYCSFISV